MTNLNNSICKDCGKPCGPKPIQQCLECHRKWLKNQGKMCAAYGCLAPMEIPFYDDRDRGLCEEHATKQL